MSFELSVPIFSERMTDSAMYKKLITSSLVMLDQTCPLLPVIRETADQLASIGEKPFEEVWGKNERFSTMFIIFAAMATSTLKDREGQFEGEP